MAEPVLEEAPQPQRMTVPLTLPNGEPNMEDPVLADILADRARRSAVQADRARRPRARGSPTTWTLKVARALPNIDSGLPQETWAGMLGCEMVGLEPEDPDDRLLKVPGLFKGGLSTLDAIESAYRYDFPEKDVGKYVAHWKALFEAVEGARARKQRRVAARVALLLCRKRYYDQLEEGEAPDGGVIVKIAQPGIEGAFIHMAEFL